MRELFPLLRRTLPEEIMRELLPLLWKTVTNDTVGGVMPNSSGCAVTSLYTCLSSYLTHGQSVARNTHSPLSCVYLHVNNNNAALKPTSTKITRKILVKLNFRCINWHSIIKKLTSSLESSLIYCRASRFTSFRKEIMTNAKTSQM